MATVAADEKYDIAAVHNEHTGSGSDVDVPPQAGMVHGFTTDLDNIPRGYYYSPAFLGTMFATGIGLAAATGAFGLAAPMLNIINNDIGPDPNISWVSLIYPVTMAVGLLLVGRLSDLFGRRWFFIGAAGIGVLGSIVCATANSVGAVIGGMVLLGLASSGQQSFAFITGEIVPMKYRFAANGAIYLGCIPFSSMGPAVSQSLILHTQAGWRWCFYLMIIVNFLSGALFFFFYYPPTFYDKFKNRTKMQQIKEFDYVGTFLFIGGFIIFLLGLSWGGSVYPWTSARVIAFMVVGGCTLIIFALWECFAPLKEPLLPVHLFKHFPWVAACVNLGIGASIYYSMAIIWPQIVGGLYADPTSMYAGYLNCVPGAMIVVGMVLGGFLAEPIGRTNFQVIFAFAVGGALVAACAVVTPDNKPTMIALLSIGIFFIGWNESVCLSCAGIELLDQKEIGTAVGAAGSIRSAVSSVANAVYLSVLANRMGATIPERVPSAVIGAGLPADSVASFIGGFSTGSFANIPGLTPQIQVIGTRAYQEAAASAYSTVFYSTLAFTGIGIILAFFNPNVDDKMTGEIAVTLHHTDVDKQAAEKVESV